MQVIAGVIRRQELRRRGWITRDLVEVDDRIVGLARANPFVERLTLGLAFSRPIRGAFERRECGAVHLQAARPRPFDELLVSRDQIRRARAWVRARDYDVVDP